MSSDVDDPPVSSLSKACFIHKRSKSQKRKLETFPSDFSKRKGLYNRLWKTVENKIKEIELSAHHGVITSITSFVKNSSYYKSSIQNNIPTAALITGVNVPDHASLFNLLSDHLSNNVTPHVVTLTSKNCSTLTGMIQHTVSTIIQNHAQNQGKQFHLKRQNCTFSTLMSWYKELKDSSLKKQSKKVHSESNGNYGSQPLVVLFEDLEAFNPRSLQDFILICSNYAGKLPLMFVFGVATTVTTVHNLLPQKASSCLAIEIFCMPPATEYLTQILHKVVMTPSLPFKLGPRVFKLLVDVVLFHDFSIVNLTRMLKFCIMEHFYSNPGAVLCCATSDLKNQLHNMTTELDVLKKVPSFTRYVKTLKKEKQAALSNSTYCKGTIKQLLEKLHNYHKKISVLVECLHVLVKDLPGYPLGKQSREIYVLALEKKLVETEDFKKAFKLLRMLSYDELMKKLQSCVTLLQNKEIKSLNLSFCDAAEMEIYMEKLKKSRDEDTQENAEKHTVLTVNLGTMTSRAHLKEKLEILAQQKKSTKYEVCRQEIIDYLESIFRDIIPPSFLPFYEVLYFDSPITVKRHLMAVPRAALQKALMNPHSYLKCNCCEHEDEDIQAVPSMPDICVAYHLYLECGKLINLFDWLQAFKAIKGNKKENRRKVQKTKSNQDSVLQAQFFQSVSELQFLGFIKATSRKTDHVTRLTWSTC